MLKQFKHLDQVLPKHERVIDASTNRMPHLTYPHDTLETLKIQHFKPERFVDWMALWAVSMLVMMVNFMSGFYMPPMTQTKWIRRTLLMETISLIPGMVASVHRYLRSIRLIKKDKGWIHHLLQESDNQRFHFFTFISLTQPGLLMRLFLLFQQVTFTAVFFFAYLISPRFCHKFHGYLEEQAFRHYSMVLQQIDKKGGVLAHWKSRPAGPDAVDYYRFDHTATLRDLILSIRADQACHQQSNHFLGQGNNDLDLEEEIVRIYHDKNQARLKNSF